MDVRGLAWDAQAKLLWDPVYSVGALGNLTTRDFVLVDLEGALSDAAAVEYTERGFVFCGVMAVQKNGVADCVAEPGAEAWAVMCRASIPFLKRVMEMSALANGGGADWLERLHALPDPRLN